MSPPSPPDHILIIGSGVFGLSTAYALTYRKEFINSHITLVSQELKSQSDSNIPKWDTSDRAIQASVDTTRIIRADYADPLYAGLAKKAQDLWRTDEWGGEGRYHESGLTITADEGSPGAAYISKSLANVRSQQKGPPQPRELANTDDIADAMRAGTRVAKGTGNLGYVNSQSGWADAEACMRDLEQKVRRRNRVKFVQGEVKHLSVDPSGRRIEGAELSDGQRLGADMTILATGAWTPALLDLRGRASTTAQVMAYYDVSEEAAMALADVPVHLNIASGCFFFPPNRKAGGGWEIKAARHAFGYVNPTRIAGLTGTPEDVEVSLPASFSTPIPDADQLMLSEFLSKALPVLGNILKPSRTRLCHYLDTQHGDFIVGHHPELEGLFLATGGSGHAFKFLPVLGEKVVDVLTGADEDHAWIRKWAYPGRSREDQVCCQDGSRSGQKGLSLLKGGEKARL